MEAYRKELLSLYHQLEKILLPTNRDCGICGKCCKAASRLRVYPVEMENIREHIVDELLFKRFQAFVNRDVIHIWGNTTGHCPFQEGVHCTIYQIRPYYCRIYGHYDHKGKSLLKGCVYQGHSVSYSHKEELPLFNKFRRLSSAFVKAQK